MDDPIFDPWGVVLKDDEAPEAPPSYPRWRSPIGPAPTPPPQMGPTPGPSSQRIPAPAPTDAPTPAPPSAESSPPPGPEPADLTGTPGLLRRVAAPRLEELARRLRMARHEASVEDALDSQRPALGLILRPWRGPWTEELSPPCGMLELAAEDGPDGHVTVRIWLDPAANEPAEESCVAPDEVGATWLEGQALHFVERLLARA